MYQPPVGARDLFPLDVAQKRWIEERLQHVFHSWGYHRIITSTLERLDTLMAGGAVEQSTVIQVHDVDNVGLRPELTASIARAAVTRMAGVTHPQRLYYNANVFRRDDRGIQNQQQEFYQAGVELLGSGSVAADAETLLVLSDCLRNLQLDSCYLVLGDAGLTRSLLSPFPNSLRDRIREAIATLDRVTLETLPMSADLRDRALLLLDLRGQPGNVLQRVSSLDLDPEQRAIVSNLKALIELLQGSEAATPALILDLSLVQLFDYYTGIVFEVVSATESGKRVLGQGGRYDQLLSLYHPQGESCPGIGFVLNIEDLHQVLLPTGQLPSQTENSDRLLVPTDLKAYAATFAYAQTLRQSGLRVEVELQGQSASAIREYAQQRRIAQIVWVSETGEPQNETVELPTGVI
ncbi:MAG: ATP phosphoribosyltransferase regulatory subunit [Drouetiella hepatica Uher 2000/2452]|jgi:ATP phosphoribosyltransferase regulatory subunit|uniref:ATP phosphoribosyltransferase regulatory subunit n=1 Tax=Drouetiella hepatica Uher 2000/2452 TaxID=904376 RepID=A0A951Q789_9CYAN|nr:ATP phosphoribosyltransferase regulatory subunit [Drouetiella hepatica Uher 2000/2452]